MKIIILGPAHPYRGGLATIMHSMAREFIERGDEVSIKTFTLQYPSFLFPGESQTLDTSAPADLDIERCVNTVNPFNWIRMGLRLKRERPDIIFMKYWTPFMAPCFGTIARIARSNGHTKVICQVDNVEPHEHHIIDRPCNHYYLGGVDGFIYMSEQVHSELKAYTQVPALFSPHPMFDNFGDSVPREVAAQKLDLSAESRYALFFGLIRDYKGLDLLLDGWVKLKAEGKTQGKKLIVAGEFYTSAKSYLAQIERGGIAGDVILHDHFVADDMVKYYFSLADFLVLPYRTATQSGVTQIAYNFCTPIVVTGVGGLPEIVPHDSVGRVCEPTMESVASAVDEMWSDDNLDRYNKNIIVERKRFSWEAMCERTMELYGIIS